MVRNDLLPRSFMMLSFVSAALVLVLQWWTSDSASSTAANVRMPPLHRASPTAASSPRSGSPLAQQAVRPISNRARSKVGFLSPDAQRSNLSLVPVGKSQLVVDLSDREVYLYQGKGMKAHYPLAVGQAGWETPFGSYRVMQMQHNPIWRHPITGEVVPTGPASPLGSRWIGFWSDGENQIGFHGTNEPELVGQAVSHGCLRMYNQDIEALYDHVTIGTPVEVQP